MCYKIVKEKPRKVTTLLSPNKTRANKNMEFNTIKDCYQEARDFADHTIAKYYLQLLRNEIAKREPLPFPFDLMEPTLAKPSPNVDKWVNNTYEKFAENLLLFFASKNKAETKTVRILVGLRWINLREINFGGFQLFTLDRGTWSSLDIDEEELRDVIWSQHTELNADNPFVLLKNPFGHNPFKYEEIEYEKDEFDEETDEDLEEDSELWSHSRSIYVKSEYFVIDFHEFVEKACGPGLSETPHSLIDSYKNKLSSFVCSMGDFAVFLSEHETLCADFFVDDILGSKVISDKAINLLPSNGAKGEQHVPEVFRLCLQEREKSTLKRFLHENKSLSHYAILCLQEFTVIELHQNTDYSPKKLPLLKMCDQTFYSLLISWDNCGYLEYMKDDPDKCSRKNKRNIKGQPLDPKSTVDFLCRSLNYERASPKMRQLFDANSDRYRQLVEIAYVWRTKWRNGHVHRDRMSTEKYEEAIVGGFSFFCLLILVFYPKPL